MVKLRLKVGPKGQILLPKIVREKLGIRAGDYAIVDFREENVVIEPSIDFEATLRWLKESRNPVASFVSRYSLEEEAVESLS